MPGTLKNYYEILGVPRSATTDQIRTAYRKLLLKFHPDKNIGDAYFEDWSKKINEAFEVLMNPEVRSEYDQVYDETRTAWKQAIVTKKETPDDKPREEDSTVPSVDAAIQKLAPVYISAKQAYIKAARNVAGIEARLNRRPLKATVHFIWGGIMLLAILLWIGITNKDLLKISLKPAAPVIDQASVIPLPLPPKQEMASTQKDQQVFEPVNLWLRVTVPKTYFFQQPGAITPDDKFLSRGNKVHAIKRSGNYYYAIFQSTVNSAYKIEGWIKSDDVEIVAQ